MEKVEGVYRLEALEPGTNKGIMVEGVDLQTIAEMDDIIIFRFPEGSSYDELESASQTIHEVIGDKKWLIVAGDVELMRLVKVA